MGFWTAITGRSKPKRPQLDNLFLVPSAAITFETTVGLRPTGTGSVCYRSASGHAFAEVQREVVELLNADPDAPDVETTQDEFGFTWLVVHRDPSDPVGPVADLHAVNTSLEEHGFSEGLLCSLIPFEDTQGRRVGLVYLYKQGTFYPFAPVPGGERKRDNLLEIQLRDTLKGELPMEADLGRWMALWGAPGL
jgi:PspAB-like protein